MKSILALTALMFASGSVYAGNGSGTMFPLTKIAYNQAETLASTPAVDTATSATEFVYFVKAEGELVQFKYVSLVNNKWQMRDYSATSSELLNDRPLLDALVSSRQSSKWSALDL